MYKIGVIGDRESILGFKAVGLDVFPVDDPDEARKILKRIGPEDIIITAGPDILINGIRDRLHTDHIICSEVDLDGRRFAYLNFKENKLKRYRELYGDQPIDAFYTDSYNDRALMEISNRVFLVKKGVTIKQIKPVKKRNLRRGFPG